MGIRAGVAAVLVLSVVCGCADNKPPPVLRARKALQAAESGHKSQGQAPSPAAPNPVRSNHAAPAAAGDLTYTAGPPPSRLPSPPEPGGPSVAGSPEYPPRVAGSAPRTHLVKQGDTLFGLARQYYGDGRKWPLIMKANPQVTAPGRLLIGQSLTIPLET